MDAKSIVEVVAALTVPICFIAVIVYRIKRDTGAGYRSFSCWRSVPCRRSS